MGSIFNSMKTICILNLWLIFNLFFGTIFYNSTVKYNLSCNIQGDCNENDFEKLLKQNQKKVIHERDSIISPDKIPGVVTFWDFQETGGSNRVSKGRYKYALEEMNGPIKRVEDGIFGPYCADFDSGQWFRIKRKDAPGLNLHGEWQQISMVAWIKRESDTLWQFIAGMWDQGSEEFQKEVRQFALYISGAWQCDYTTYERTKAKNQTHGFISTYGGATPGHPYAFDYATGKTKIQKNRWYMIAYTYDGEVIKVYVNGELDNNGNYNPFFYKGGIYDAGEIGSDFSVALHIDEIPENSRAKFDGRIGGLAVYDRALSSDEIYKLYKSTMF